MFGRFLAEKGDGVNHIAVRATKFDDTAAMEAQRGNELALSWNFGDIKIAYLATDQDLRVFLEIFSGFPNADNAGLRIVGAAVGLLQGPTYSTR